LSRSLRQGGDIDFTPPAGLCYKPHISTTFAGKSPLLNVTDPTSPWSLIPAFERQNRIFSSAFSILDDAIAQRAFPAASVAIAEHDALVGLKAFGHFTYHPDSPPPTTATLFDLASLTKVVATTPMSMILYQRGLLDLDAPVAAIIPEFVSSPPGKDPRRRDVTIRMLLAHSSGLPGYERLFLNGNTRDQLLRAALAVPLTADPNTRPEYSDIGFMILSEVLERLAGESLDRFCQREVFGPLGMTNTTFNPPAETRQQIPPTADEREQECGAGAPAREKPASARPPGASPNSPSRFRSKIIQGEVQDENAFVLGGVAAHAGLFSTAEDLAKFAHTMLGGGRPILRPETVALFTRRQSAPHATSRALGWDTPSSASQSGKYFGPNSFGHLGYTGTSLWIDPDRQLSVTLLTNRTWPDCSNRAIRQVRPRFHDALIESLPQSG
jgi:CubicO group peptidase (beta-lactamase class C family)